MKIDVLYQKFKTCTSISTDTRKVNEGVLFFALKGDNFDGNTFVEKAFKAGAKYCVIDDKNAAINSNCILVEDVLSTLQQLAAHHRKAINITILALTGSNGKTTTKELIQVVLASTYKVSATKGNLNNHIGVPLTLLSFTEDLDFGIVEMGANHQKEIEFLAAIAQPDYGLITNFGKAHLEGFGGVEGVIKGKSELYDYLKTNSKTAFINRDDAKQVSQIGSYKHIITFGSKPDNTCIIKFKDAHPFVNLNYDNTEIASQLIGDYNYSNIAVAIAIGNHFKVTTKAIKNTIERYKPNNNRSEIIKKGNTKIILDAYNANPTSMLAALKNFKQLKAKYKYLFLGDMFELGNEAKKEHQNIADFVAKNFESTIFLVGENFHKTQTKAHIKKFNSFKSLIPELQNLKLDDSLVLIKGSRGMALERILEHIN